MRALMTLTALALFSAAVYGDLLTPITQDRTISVMASDGDEVVPPTVHSNSDAATDFLLFDSDVTAHVSNADAGASQTSQILANGIECAGSVLGNETGNTDQTPSTDAVSSMIVVFDLASPANYSFSGTITATEFISAGGGDYQGLFRLSGPGGTVFELVATETAIDGHTDVLNDDGVLLPGQYTLTVSAEVSSWAREDAGIGANFDTALSLTPSACPDLNGDGSVNISDLGTMLANFGMASGATLADGDVNGDGAVNTTDLGLLLSEFGTSC